MNLLTVVAASFSYTLARPYCFLPGAIHFFLETQINERLWNRLLPGSSNNTSAHHQGQGSPPPTGDHFQQQPRPGAPAAAGATATAPNSLASSCPSPSSSYSPTAQQLPPQREQPPPQLLSLFNDEGDSDTDGSRMGPSKSAPPGRGNPPSSRGQSLRPWEWPDICRGAPSGPRTVPKEAGQKKELLEEYFTPRDEERSTACRYDPDDRDGPPPLEWRRRGKESGEAGGEAAPTDGVRLDRRGIRGGLGHVRKSLWGPMFEGTYVCTTIE